VGQGIEHRAKWKPESSKSDKFLPRACELSDKRCMGLNWQALSELKSQFDLNVEWLAARDAAMAQAMSEHQAAQEYLVSSDGLRLQLARRSENGIEVLPNPVPPMAARDIARKLYTNGRCTEPVMIAGLDHGWLWQTLYQLECETPRTPGHRPPLYFLTRDIERLWLLMHVHDWSGLLSDQRVRLFVGADPVEQCFGSMIEHPHIPWAKLCVTIDPGIWQCHSSLRQAQAGGGTAAASVDSLWQQAHQHANQRMQQLHRQIEALYAGTDVKAQIRRVRGEKLRVLGITSYFTTFLKHSMGDWLEALQSLGHETQMCIEQADHEIANSITIAEQIVQFRPDLIVMIDHYRAEMTGLPKQVPCVMWVQDNLPNIFSAKAGAAQGPRDYCLGFGRLHLRDACGYPEKRFMPAQVGVNETRFAPMELSPTDLNDYGCDVSFVSHASTPATVLLTDQLNRADAAGKKLLIDIFEQMRAVYDSGRAITHARIIQDMVQKSLVLLRVQLDTPTRQMLLDFFTQRINNALFRHQSLTWAADLDINLHLWGRGWDQHPRFARYAREVACNQTQLRAIYQASKINLQITPTGAVHQRLLDGLAAGGFFLMRYCPGDVVEQLYRQLFEWCHANDVSNNDELRSRATTQVQELLAQVKSLLGIDPFELSGGFIDVLRLAADGQYIRSAASIWPEYDQVSFGSAQQLRERVDFFLKHPDQRTQITHAMREPVIARFSYRSISQCLLDFIADDMQRNLIPQEAAA
jgi:hypothetical protein